MPDNGQPSLNNIQATSITSSSLTLSWDGSNANAYTIKYGTEKNHLTNTRTLESSEAVPTYTLSKLPSGQTIYIQITPANDSTAGPSETASFKTKKGSNAGIVFFWILLTLVAVIAIVMILVRRRLRLETTSADQDLESNIQNIPTFPQETSAHESERLNWWMPEEQRHEAAQHPGQNLHEHRLDEIPDMYEEGRKRLEDEEKGRDKHQ